MRTTLTLDDELVARAMEMTGIEDRRQLMEAGLQCLITREASRRLILLGGSNPDFVAPPRRRFPAVDDVDAALDDDPR